MNEQPLSRRLTHIFALVAAAFTLIVLTSGGMVTSKGVGMSVPDWPTTYGYNMFLFPYSKWVGGIFFEHSHRLLATGIGMISIGLCVWLWISESRFWVKILGTVVVVSIVLQGVIGGLRVVLNEAQIGILHGILAQSLFVLLGILAASVSPAFVAGRWAPPQAVGGLRWLGLILVGAVFSQLVIAATMRHAHAGLSIPDFPAAYGHFLPDTSPAAVAQINASRETAHEVPTTAALIWLQMAHRAMALVIFTVIVTLAWKTRRALAGVRHTALMLVGMVLVQIGLGAWTIWSNKAADVATAHMALGALILFISARLAFRLFVMQHGVREESLEFSAGARYSGLSA
jgi:cytochrome c oxidase assembly protein subunit 15